MTLFCLEFALWMYLEDVWTMELACIRDTVCCGDHFWVKVSGRIVLVPQMPSI
jgi:hypothetical protein